MNDITFIEPSCGCTVVIMYEDHAKSFAGAYDVAKYLRQGLTMKVMSVQDACTAMRASNHTAEHRAVADARIKALRHRR